MARPLREQDIKPALKLATPATKKLVIAGVNGDEDFPELLAKYTWTGTRDYNMALIIIAFYAYCMKSEAPDLKKFGLSALREGSFSNKMFDALREGNGKKVKYNMGSYFQNSLDKVLKQKEVLPDVENSNEQSQKNKDKRAKIIKSFINQAGKITPWVINQNDIDKLINQLTGRVKYKNKPSISLLKTLASSREITNELLDEVKELLNYGADPNVKDNNGWTALQLALCVWKGRELITLLLYYGADPDVKNNDGQTSLHWAADLHRYLEMTMLLKHGANPNIQDKNGNAPLHIAVVGGDRNIVKLLLNHRADPNLQNNFGCTPLHRAVRSRIIDIIVLLLDHDADPNAQNRYGNTPLHWVDLGDERIVNLLLAHNADPNAQNNQGNTPLHKASIRRNREIVALLLDHGADPNIRNNRGRTYRDLLPQHLRRRLSVADFPQDEFRRSLANGETKDCPICMDDFSANDLCCIFNCQHSEDYPFGHYLCNDCAQGLLDDQRSQAVCPQCRKGLKRRR